MARYLFLHIFCCFILTPASQDSIRTPSKQDTSYEGMKVRAVILKNLGFTKEHTVLRELDLKAGDIFKRSTFESNLRDLEKLDIFAEIATDIRVRENELELVYSFKEIPLLVLHPTGEYTEENKLSLGAGVISTNMWGSNHFFQASYKTGFLGIGVQRFSLEYSIPRLFDRRLRASVWLADERRQNELDEFFEKYQIARLQLFQALVYKEKYRVVAKLESSVEAVRADKDSITLADNNQDILPGIGPALIFDSRNYAGNPTRGVFFELGLMQYGSFLGGNVDYTQGILDLRWYVPLTTRQHLLFSHLTTLQSGSLGEDLPAYRGFWMGGANSVRGYDMDWQRGKNQMLFSCEYRFLLLKPTAIPLYVYNWYLDLGLQPLLGFDWGNTWDDSITEKDWLNGFIVGLQVLVPYIQMVRFELGLSPFMEVEKLEVRFHLSAIEKPEAQRFRRR